MMRKGDEGTGTVIALLVAVVIGGLALYFGFNMIKDSSETGGTITEAFQVAEAASYGQIKLKCAGWRSAGAMNCGELAASLEAVSEEARMCEGIFLDEALKYYSIIAHAGKARFDESRLFTAESENTAYCIGSFRSLLGEEYTEGDDVQAIADLSEALREEGNALVRYNAVAACSKLCEWVTTKSSQCESPDGCGDATVSSDLLIAGNLP